MFPESDGTATYITTSSSTNQECWNISDGSSCTKRPDCVYQTYQTIDLEGNPITEGICSEFNCSMITNKIECNNNLPVSSSAYAYCTC